MEYLTENSTTPIVCALIAAVLCVLIWKSNRERFWRNGIFVMLGLAGCFWLVDVLVESDREHLQATAAKIVAEADQRKLPTFIASIDTGYRGYCSKKKNFINQAQDKIQSEMFKSVALKGCTITFREDNTALMKLVVQVGVRGALTGRGVTVSIDLHWKKFADGGWRIYFASDPKHVFALL